MSNITKVIPVIITRDDIGGSLVLNAYLRSRFREILRRKSLRNVIVTPLFSLSAQDIELIAGYLRESALSELLEERYRNDPRLLSTFWAVDNFVVRRIGARKCDLLTAAFSEITEMIQLELFGGGSELP